jgi:heat-inducible transcriptional repressor
MLEDTNVWKNIAYEQAKTGKTMITFGEKLGNKDAIVATTNIDLPESKRQISILAPVRADYASIKGVLEFIKYELENKKD